MQSPRSTCAAVATAIVALGIAAVPAGAARPARTPLRGSTPRVGPARPRPR
jgi:hypothetical protein